MINLILSLLPGRAWLYGGMAAALALLIGWHVFHEAEARREAVFMAVAVNDAKWRASIAKANADADAKLSALQSQADKAGREVSDTAARLSDALKEIERTNANVPNAPACALDRDRVRLLDRLRQP